MRKRLKILSILVGLSIIYSPRILMSNHIVMAEELRNEINQGEYEDNYGKAQFTTGPALNYTKNINIMMLDEDMTIDTAIKGLREYYSNKSELTFRSALGYNYTSNYLEEDLAAISSKFNTNENAKSATEHVGNIMGLIAAGKDPYNYNDKDYVTPLARAQNKDGKFIVREGDDYPTTQAFSILALDMAGADYNKNIAKEALLGYQDDKDSFGGIDGTGMVLAALGKHRGDSRVQASIDKSLLYLQKEQDPNTGGFIAWEAVNPESASAVIQGLIAVGQDPLSQEWTKRGQTPLDSLLSFYKDGDFGRDMATEQGFIALADLYRGKSMFNELRFSANPITRIKIQTPSLDRMIEGDFVQLDVMGYDSEGVIIPIGDLIWTSSNDEIATIDKNGRMSMKQPGQIIITAKIKDREVKHSMEIEVLEKDFQIKYIGDVSANQGDLVNVNFKIKNLKTSERPVTLIVGLHNKETHKLEDYSIISNYLASEEEIDLSAGVLVPKTGSYYIKAFVWDDLSKQNIIMRDVKEITINK